MDYKRILLCVILFSLLIATTNVAFASDDTNIVIDDDSDDYIDYEIEDITDEYEYSIWDCLQIEVTPDNEDFNTEDNVVWNVTIKNNANSSFENLNLALYIIDVEEYRIYDVTYLNFTKGTLGDSCCYFPVSEYLTIGSFNPGESTEIYMQTMGSYPEDSYLMCYFLNSNNECATDLSNLEIEDFERVEYCFDIFSDMDDFDDSDDWNDDIDDDSDDSDDWNDDIDDDLDDLDDSDDSDDSDDWDDDVDDDSDDSDDWNDDVDDDSDDLEDLDDSDDWNDDVDDDSDDWDDDVDDELNESGDIYYQKEYYYSDYSISVYYNDEVTSQNVAQPIVKIFDNRADSPSGSISQNNVAENIDQESVGKLIEDIPKIISSKSDEKLINKPKSISDIVSHDSISNMVDGVVNTAVVKSISKNIVSSIVFNSEVQSENQNTDANDANNADNNVNDKVVKSIDNNSSSINYGLIGILLIAIICIFVAYKKFN